MYLHGEFLSAENSGNLRKFDKLAARHKRLDALLRTEYVNGDRGILERILTGNKNRLRTLVGITTTDEQEELLKDHYISRADEIVNEPDMDTTDEHEAWFEETSTTPEKARLHAFRNIKKIRIRNMYRIRFLSGIRKKPLGDAVYIERADMLWERPMEYAPEYAADPSLEFFPAQPAPTEVPTEEQPDYLGDFSNKDHPYHYVMEQLGLS